MRLDPSNDWKATTKELPDVTWDLKGNKKKHYYTAVCTGDGTYIKKEVVNDEKVLSGEGPQELELNLEAQMTAAAGVKYLSLYIDSMEEGHLFTNNSYTNGFNHLEPVLDKIEISGDSAIIKIEYNANLNKSSADWIGFALLKIQDRTWEETPKVEGRYAVYKISGLSSITDQNITVVFYTKYYGDPWPDFATKDHIIEDPANTNTISYASSSGKRISNRSAINAGPSVIGLKKPEHAKPVKGADGNDIIVTLGESNKWQHTWNDLPQYDDKGNKLYYYVEEVLDPPQNIESVTYTYKCWNDKPWEGIEKVTVTNTLPDKPSPEKTSIKVTKLWKDYNGNDLSAGEIEDYHVEVQLQRRSGTGSSGTLGSSIPSNWSDWSSCGSTVLSKDNNWTHTWTNLLSKEYSDATTYTEYQYQVLEVVVKDSRGNVVENFNSETTSTAGVFTITNTKKRQGITLPGTGSKYPWIFYGIGMTFMLIALVWMRRALKKSYIPSDTGKGGRRSDE